VLHAGVPAFVRLGAAAGDAERRASGPEGR